MSKSNPKKYLIKKDEIAIRTPKPKWKHRQSTNSSGTEKSLDKDTNILSAKRAFFSSLGSQNDKQNVEGDSKQSVTTDKAQRTAAPSDRLQCVSRTETHINDDFDVDFSINEIAIRTQASLAEGEYETSRTEKTIGYETDIPKKCKHKCDSHRKKKSQRVSLTEVKIRVDFGHDLPASEVAIRTPPRLAEGENDTSRTEKTIGEESDKPKKRKAFPFKEEGKRSKSKSKQDVDGTQLHLSDKAIRTTPKSEIWSLLSKTKTDIKCKTISEKSVRSDRAIRTPPKDGENLYITERDIENYHADKINATPNIQAFDFFNGRDMPSFKTIAILAMIGIYLLIFVSQIWRIFNALNAVYDVSVDDCYVANSLCHRYSMCCFNQCGNSRFQIFWSKLFGG